MPRVVERPVPRRQFVDAIAETPPGNAPVFTMEVMDDLLTGGRPREPTARAIPR